MPDTPPNLTREQRKAAVANWLGPIPPAKPQRVTLIQKLSPWRLEFVEAIQAGYSWQQLAEHVAKQPEIGVNVSGGFLKECIRNAFIAAKEPVPAEARAKKTPKKKPTATEATSA
jgi:hypothetical protein